jgi:hypothetical protein
MTAEPMAVPVEPITADTFAAYGDLLDQPQLGARQDFAARVENHQLPQCPLPRQHRLSMPTGWRIWIRRHNAAGRCPKPTRR